MDAVCRIIKSQSYMVLTNLLSRAVGGAWVTQPLLHFAAVKPPIGQYGRGLDYALLV